MKSPKLQTNIFLRSKKNEFFLTKMMNEIAVPPKNHIRIRNTSSSHIKPLWELDVEKVNKFSNNLWIIIMTLVLWLTGSYFFSLVHFFSSLWFAQIGKIHNNKKTAWIFMIKWREKWKWLSLLTCEICFWIWFSTDMAVKWWQF